MSSRKVRELLTAARPPPAAQQRLAELQREQVRLRALGQRADPARLAQVRLELDQLARGGAEPSCVQLGRGPGLGPERSGLTIGR